MKELFSEFKSKQYIKMYIHIIISLLIGSFIYLMFRTTDLLVFFFIDKLGLMNEVLIFRESLSFIDLPSFILYCLPDSCWVYSFTLYLGVFSNNEWIKKKWRILLLLLPAILGIASELGQLITLISGTFDVWDIFAYLLGSTLAFIVLKISNFL